MVYSIGQNGSKKDSLHRDERLLSANVSFTLCKRPLLSRLDDRENVVVASTSFDGSTNILILFLSLGRGTVLWRAFPDAVAGAHFGQRWPFPG
jgi:hypothetical protein